MAKDPAFNFYSDNFLSGTMFFTDEQTGKYIRLLCAQHQSGHLSEKQMNIICKSYDIDIFNKFIKDDEGLYFNERLEIEINKRKKYSESRSNNKKGKVKEEIICKSYDNHMGIGKNIILSSIIKDNIINNDIIETCFSFDDFWNLYNKKVDTKKCREKYNKLSEHDRSKIKVTLTIYLSSVKDKQFLKNPLTYLNGQCWNDNLFEPKQIIEADRICWYLNNARQQEDKKVKGTYLSYLKAKDFYKEQVTFLEYA